MPTVGEVAARQYIFRFKPRHVLVIDDEASIRAVLCRMLARSGFRPLPAGSLEEAMQLSETEWLGAVVLDLGLPRSGAGLEFLDWFRSQPQHDGTPVVVLTGNVHLNDEQLARIYMHGARVLYKPVSLATLRDHLVEASAADVRGSWIGSPLLAEGARAARH